MIIIVPFSIILVGINFYGSIANVMNIKKLFLYVQSWNLNRLVFEEIMKGDFQYFNGDITFSQFYSWIPRAIFPEKPSVIITSTLPSAISLPSTKP